MEYCSKCGTQLKEEENFCPQCGKAKNQSVQTSYAEETPQQSPQCDDSLKKFLYIALPLAIGCLLGFTCPDKEKHVETISNDLMNVLETSNKSENEMYSLMGGAVIKKVLNSNLKVNQYALFSTGTFTDGKDSKLLSIGILGTVFTFIDKDELDEMNQSLESEISDEE
jgi:hypothetical protein